MWTEILVWCAALFVTLLLLAICWGLVVMTGNIVRHLIEALLPPMRETEEGSCCTFLSIEADVTETPSKGL